MSQIYILTFKMAGVHIDLLSHRQRQFTWTFLFLGKHKVFKYRPSHSYANKY